MAFFSRKKVNVKRAKISPANEFEHPEEVVKNPEISHEDKKKILSQWQTDADALSRANDEGMTGGELPRLDEVQHAQKKVDIAHNKDPEKPQDPE